MRERNRGSVLMVIGGVLCAFGILWAGKADSDNEVGVWILFAGATMVLSGAILSGTGAIADAIRPPEPEEDEDLLTWEPPNKSE